MDHLTKGGTMALTQVLGDVTVVELAGDVAGSYAGKVLADLGATVTKVEAPGGDPLRRHRLAPTSCGIEPRSGAWLHLNTNKHGCVLDAADPDRARQIERLLDGADLVIVSSSHDPFGHWGLDWSVIQAARPGLSVVLISGYGASGPYAGYRWDDLTAQAFSGTLWPQEGPGSQPVKLPVQAAMCFVGHVAAVGGLAAVMAARRGGRGAVVDCAAIEALASMPSRAFGLLRAEYLGPDAPAGDGPVGPTLLPNGVFPCGDGYVVSSAAAHTLDAMLAVLDDDDLRAAFARPDAFERGDTKEFVDVALYAWLLTHTRRELTDAAQANGWILAGVNDLPEVLAASHLRQRGFWARADDPVAGPVDLPGLPARFAEGGWALHRSAPRLGVPDVMPDDRPPVSPAAPRPSGATEQALTLAGVRVLDMTAVWSGPYATMLLADLGAEVIRVENPWVFPPVTKGYQPRPTITNAGMIGSTFAPANPDVPDRTYNRSAANNVLGRNKRSCTIDTRRAEGRELLFRLAERSDVFVENLRSQALERMGVHVGELQARNPRLVVVRLPACGTTGDWASYAAYGPQVSGLSGLTWLHGDHDTDVAASPMTTYMDAATGPAAVLAVLAALNYRDRVGRGQVVEISQMENLIHHFGHAFVDHQLGVVLEREGNRDATRAPAGLYPCRGGERLAISVADDTEWAALARTAAPTLAGDPRLAHLAGRLLHHDEIDSVLTRWTEERAAHEAFHELQRAGVTAAPLLDVPSFMSDRHVVAREWLRPLRCRDTGVHIHPGTPYRGLEQRWWRGSPALGEDNEYVYKELLGVSDADYERYRADQILAEDYLDRSGRPH